MYYNLSYPEDAEVEKKVNLFFNYFRFVADYIGLIDDLPLENHLSLVEKIIFQIKHNLEYCIVNVDNYLDNPLLLKNDPLINSFTAYRTLQPLVGQYSQIGKNKEKKKNFIEQTPGFKIALEELHEELSDKAFKISLDEIIRLICDASPANRFIHEITCHVRLLVSEFLFNHRSKSDAIRILDDISDPDRFPYPSGVTKEEKKEYFANLSLKDRLRAIYELYKKDRYQHTFVCKIYNMGTHPSFEFTESTVTFQSKEKSEENFRYENEWEKDKIAKFLNDGEEYILAYLPVAYYSFYYKEVAMRTATDTIRKALSLVNDSLKTNGLVDTREYLLLDRKGKPQGSGVSATSKINTDSVTKLEDNSARIFLAERDNEAKKHILKHEPYLADAMLSGKIADYWHYLETIVSNALPGQKKVKDFCSSILLINHLSYQKNRTTDYIMTLTDDTHYDYLWLSQEKWIALRQREVPIDELLAEVRNPLIEEIANRYICNDSKNSDYKALKEYYTSILTEAYEQRNAFQHAGYECDKAVIKLNHTLHRLVIRFRWLILERADVPGEITFAEVLNQLKAEGDQLLSSTHSI